MENRERKHRVTLRLSDDEYRILKGKTKACNYRDMSDTMRHLIIEGMLYEVDYSYLREYNIQLGKIGNNINQVVHRANETRSIYQTDVNELKKEMDEVWRLQKSMLSKQPLREQ